MRKNCSNCLFYGECRQDDICEFYVSVDPECIAAADGDDIENSRIEFFAEWFKYIDEDGD